MEVANQLQTFEQFFSSHNFSFRTVAFQILSHTLLELKRPIVIVETGCMRPPRAEGLEWEDGQSTMVWDWLAQTSGGMCCSVDVSQENVRHAKERLSESTTVACCDSISWLRGSKFKPAIDLLYLDSMDYHPESGWDCALHHAGELAAVWNQLAPGAYIAVDDCQQPYKGKHALIKMFFEILGGVHPYGIGPISVWRKP